MSVQKRQRFRSLSTSLPDVDNSSRIDQLSLNMFASYQPIDEEEENNLADVSEEGAENELPLEKFRRIVNSLIIQNRWTKITKQKVSNTNRLKKRGKEANMTDDDDIISFNPGAFKSTANRQQFISPEIKKLLHKPLWKRNQQEVAAIFKAIDTLQVFQKFPSLVKQELAKSLHYETFGDGRIIIQQGHIGFSLYFIVKGTVAVEVSTVDDLTGKVYKQIVNEISSGGSFGEMALMSGLKRAATVICIGTSEFLRIDKEDFQQVLMRSYRREWERKISHMEQNVLFNGWSLKEIRAAATMATIHIYKSNKVIIPNIKEHRGCVYIILSGNCQAVAKVDVIKEKLPFGRQCMQLIKNANDVRLSRYQTIDHLYLVIRTMGKNECFGLGELLPNTSIISKDRVEVLSVPTVHLLRHGSCLDGFRDVEMAKYPKLTKAFQSYLTQIKWQKYKETLNKNISLNRTVQIPISQRTISDYAKKKQNYSRSVRDSLRLVSPASKNRTSENS